MTYDFAFQRLLCSCLSPYYKKNCIEETKKSLENMVTIIYIIFAELDEEKIRTTHII
jgi:hypothetical protein